MNRHKRWIRITECGNIPLREGRLVKVAGHNVAIFNLGDRFLAVENRCPHKGGPLSDGVVSGSTIVCPLHAWRVDLETGAVMNSGGARSCLTTFPTRMDAGVVLLEMPVELAIAREASSQCVERDGSSSWMEVTPAANRYVVPIGND